MGPYQKQLPQKVARTRLSLCVGGGKNESLFETSDLRLVCFLLDLFATSFPYLYLDIHNISRHISRIIVKMSSTCQGISWDSPIRWMSHRLSPRRSRCSRSFRPPTTLVPPTIEKPGSALGEHGDRAPKHNTQLLVYSVYINGYKSLKHDYAIQCIYVLNMFKWSYS